MPPKYLKQTTTGRVYPYTKILAKRKDMREYEPPTPENTVQHTGGTKPSALETPVSAVPAKEVQPDGQPPESETPTEQAAPQVPASLTYEDLEKMTKEELLELAKTRGLDVRVRDAKEDLIKTIMGG